MWHDGVAPESALDFDAPHMSTREAVAWWIGGFAFFAGVASLVALTNPAGKKPGVSFGGRGAGCGAVPLCRRTTTHRALAHVQLARQLPESTFKNALGGYREAAAEREPRTIVR